MDESPSNIARELTNRRMDNGSYFNDDIRSLFPSVFSKIRLISFRIFLVLQYEAIQEMTVNPLSVHFSYFKYMYIRIFSSKITLARCFVSKFYMGMFCDKRETVTSLRRHQKQATKDLGLGLKMRQRQIKRTPSNARKAYDVFKSG